MNIVTLYVDSTIKDQGVNNKNTTLKRKAYGFREDRYISLSVFSPFMITCAFLS